MVYQRHLNGSQPRLFDGDTCECGSMILCLADPNAGGKPRQYGRVCCAFKAQCFSLVIKGEPTEDEKRILKENAAARQANKATCPHARPGCTKEGNRQCPYDACKTCCGKLKKLCLAHGKYNQASPDWKAEGLSDGLPSQIWYVTGQPIGSGGFAEIYHGRWGLKEVAIKKPIPQDPQTPKRIENELDVWKKVQHPKLVPLLATIDGSGLASMVTPFYRNGNLGAYLSQTEVGLEHRYRLLADVAEGLKYLHCTKNGTAHGDLSMGNILVADDGYALLTDFGLALPPGGRTGYSTSGNEHGCTAYKAPECFEPAEPQEAKVAGLKARTPASDMWAFGIIIVQVLSNQSPWEGAKPAAIFTKIEKGLKPFTDAAIDRCQMPTKLKSQVRACFNKDPKERPIISELLHELKAI
ncbi:kinase-like domain-containing protein [Cantharellus anzutake]|uniref:kinase-like domain-containing protein n=1 Tax=Cantharellus anzutake TaxID=1750568 RepID=UPI001905290C|nr:kinase-like domain-containing protein [Cantharellus anzutake]KAF8344061.1 kinase-like domain-containing protein [Cantharellus anzutake]